MKPFPTFSHSQAIRLPNRPRGIPQIDDITDGGRSSPPPPLRFGYAGCGVALVTGTPLADLDLRSTGQPP